MQIKQVDYNYNTSYNIYTQHIDINPSVDIKNYKYGGMIYKHFNKDITDLQRGINEYNEISKYKLNINTIRELIEQLEEYKKPYHIEDIDNEYLVDIIF